MITPARLALAALLGTAAAQAHAAAIAVRVVVVTTFENDRSGPDTGGEFQAWTTGYPLPTHIAFPQGYHELRYDPHDHVLGLVTGEGTARAAASITALGHDPRFDLTHAYWVVAGIAGVDPNVASVGSAAWARYVVDGDLAYEIDAREIPPGAPTGYIPLGRTRPYEPPVPPADAITGQNSYTLDRGLADWAFSRTRTIALPDDATLRAVRAPYTEPAAKRPPFVLEGDDLAAGTFWVGALLNRWAEQWVRYWTAGKATFTMSLEEDSGILQAITFLGQARLADPGRVLILRTASDYTVPPPGQTPADLIKTETTGGLSGYTESLRNAFLVASPVVRELATHWPDYRSNPPQR